MGAEKDTNCTWCPFERSPQTLKWTGGTVDHRKNRDHPDHSPVKINKNTRKSPWDLRRLAVIRLKLWHNNCKTKHDWAGKVVHWKLCKEFKFGHTNKWYSYNPQSVLVNETHILQWGLEIKTDHLLSARRPDLKILNKKKKNLKNCQVCCSGWPQSKIERKQKEV